MFYSLKGYVDVVKSDYIVLDVHDVCYQITVSHPSDYKVDELVRVFTYQVVREDEQYLVGFKSIEEKEIFMSLISVKGIGPRTAINALSQTTPNQIIDAIRNSNVVFLKKLPGIGAKAAIGSTFNIMPEKYIMLFDLYKKNKKEEAITVQGEVNAIIEVLCKVGIFKGIKEVLTLQGMDCGVCRKPFQPLTETQKALVKETAEKYRII